MQYLDYLGGVLHGDFGTSIATKRPVLDEFLALFPATLELSICAIAAGHRPRRAGRHLRRRQARLLVRPAVMGTALVGYSMPIFWWGLLLIIFFSG